MSSRSAVAGLTVVALVLPAVMVVLYGIGRLLGSMGDNMGECVVLRVSQGCGIFWAICLIGLLLALAAHALERPGDRNS